MDQGSVYDLVIIGSGAAGLGAGLQAGRFGLKTVILEREMIGGWLVNADLLDDYPGFADGVQGMTLAMTLTEQVEKVGVETRFTEATRIERRSGGFVVGTPEGPLSARAAIIASGAAHQKLGVPREEELEGSGISYCATCDGALFRNQPVAVVGGNDDAVREALFLTQHASKVVVVHDGPQLDACDWLRQRAASNPKLEVRLGVGVEAIVGDALVEGLRLKHRASGTESLLEVTGVFVALVGCPRTEFLSGLLGLSPGGAVPTDATMATEVVGLFAAGMVREGHVGNPAAAVGEGIVAAQSAKRFLE